MKLIQISTSSAIYTSQIGIREKPSNAGPAVEQYLRYVNLAKGNPWCAAFVCWVYGKAWVANGGSPTSVSSINGAGHGWLLLKVIRMIRAAGKGMGFIGSGGW